jgi:hypothetical protein
MMNEAAAVSGAKKCAYPHYLERVEQELGDIQLTCWYDFEPADPSVGWPATAWLIRAHVRGDSTDISELLRDSAVKTLEAEAADYLSGGG